VSEKGMGFFFKFFVVVRGGECPKRGDTALRMMFTWHARRQEQKEGAVARAGMLQHEAKTTTRSLWKSIYFHLIKLAIFCDFISMCDSHFLYPRRGSCLYAIRLKVIRRMVWFLIIVDKIIWSFKIPRFIYLYWGK